MLSSAVAELIRKFVIELVVTIERDAATKALALRWVRLARDGLESRFRIRSETLRQPPVPPT